MVSMKKWIAPDLPSNEMHYILLYFWSNYSSLPQNKLKPCLLCTSCERLLNNSRVFRALITESQSHFERSERVKTFIEVSLHRQNPELCSVRRILEIEELLMISILLLLLINWIYPWPKAGWKKNIIFIVLIINQCTWLQQFIVHLLFSLDFQYLRDSQPSFPSCLFFEGHFDMLLDEMKIISRVEVIRLCYSIFLEVIGPLLTARRFAEFDTSAVCHTMFIICLGWFLLQDCMF